MSGYADSRLYRCPLRRILGPRFRGHYTERGLNMGSRDAKPGMFGGVACGFALASDVAAVNAGLSLIFALEMALLLESLLAPSAFRFKRQPA